MTMPLAFGFANLAMLGWLAAAAVPIVIHLWNRRRYREVSWAAIDFLLAAVRKNARRLLVEQWLLLALRTALIALLALAVAEPFWEARAARFQSGAPTHRVLLIDGSLSMNYRPTERSRFEEARQRALQVVDESGPGDGFTLVLVAEPPQAIIASPAFDPASVRAEIEAATATHGRANLSAALALADDLVRRAKTDFPRLQQAEVCIFSDLDRTTWGGASAEQARELRRLAAKVAESAELTVIDVGQARVDNAAVTAVRAADPLVVASQEISLEAELRNFGAQPRAGQVVELLIDGAQVATEQVDLPPGGAANVAFRHRFLRPGPQAATVRLAADLLEADNRRSLALDVRESLRALCVDGRYGERPRGATAYLAVALAPESPPQRNLIRPEVAPETSLVEADLAAFDMLFLCDVPRFTPNEAKLLSSYLESGGGVVLFLGPQSRLDNYNEQLGAGGSKILPGKLTELAAEGQYTLDPLDYAHPLLAAFRDNPRSGLTTAPIQRYAKLELDEGAEARVAARFSSGDPAIIESRVGRGRLLLVATSADTSWSVLPVMPAYLPLVQEMAARAVGARAGDRNSVVGQPLGPPTRRLARQAVEIERPDERKDTVRPPQGGANWEYTDTLISGLYRLRAVSAPSETDVCAVNVDPAESELARLDPAALREEIWKGVPHVTSAAWSPSDAPAKAEGGGKSTLAQGLLLCVAGMLLGELGLAWYFGNRGA